MVHKFCKNQGAKRVTCSEFHTESPHVWRPGDPRPVPRDPWLNFSDSYLEVYLFFKLKEMYFVKNNHGNSLIGDAFISYDRIYN